MSDTVMNSIKNNNTMPNNIILAENKKVDDIPQSVNDNIDNDNEIPYESEDEEVVIQEEVKNNEEVVEEEEKKEEEEKDKEEFEDNEAKDNEKTEEENEEEENMEEKEEIKSESEFDEDFVDENKEKTFITQVKERKTTENNIPTLKMPLKDRVIEEEGLSLSPVSPSGNKHKFITMFGTSDPEYEYYYY